MAAPRIIYAAPPASVSGSFNRVKFSAQRNLLFLAVPDLPGWETPAEVRRQDAGCGAASPGSRGIPAGQIPVRLRYQEGTGFFIPSNQESTQAA